MKSLASHMKSLRILPVAIAATGMLALIASCSNDKKEFVNRETDGELVPTMMTRNVETLISDSGITRYRITTPLWLIFDEAKQPTWKFPDGLHLEKYDNFLRRDASIDADSATYFKDVDLWRLDGRVYIVNTAGEKFLSEQLYWSNRDHKVYTDSFIHIERHDRIIEGYGFVSNDRMTNYSVNRVSGIFPVSDFRGGTNADSTATAPADTVVAVTKSVQPKPATQQAKPAPSDARLRPIKPDTQLRLKPNSDVK